MTAPKNIRKKPLQKLVSFTNNKLELDKITAEMEEGWAIISLVQNGNYYIGVMEKMDNTQQPGKEATIFIPPRKKIRISY